MIYSLLGGSLVFATLARGNPVYKTPTVGETRLLWEQRVKELSAILTSTELAQTAFKEFLEKENKVVNEDEMQHRFHTFRGNVKKALNLNVKSDGKAVFGITKFMDLTEQEFAKYHKNGGKTFSDEDITAALADGTEYEPMGFSADGSRDWRKEGVITPVKNQAQCGSCWAFSTVEAVESAARILDKATTFIGAPQELVSCDHNMDMGCNGGLPTHAYGWLKSHGLESEADYPYTSGSGDSGTCKADYSKGSWKVTSYTRVAHGMRFLPWTVSRGEKAMKDYMLNKGPMSIGVDASTWQTYQQGVLDAETCSPMTVDHAVQVVALTQGGSGSTWTVRNSWASEWGEQGFIRLSEGENTCLITAMATAPTVAPVAAGVEAPFYV